MPMEMPQRPSDVWDVVTCLLSDPAVEHLKAMCDAAEQRLMDAGEELLYTYIPGDGRGRRYVFRNKTCIGLAAARQYVNTCLDNANRRKERDGDRGQAAVGPSGEGSQRG